MNKKKVVVCADESDPRFEEVSTHAMLRLASGVWYHARLDTIFIVKSALEV